jgi:hypothetical protein
MEVHLVRVITDDRRHKLWVTATPRHEAVNRALDAIPRGWAPEPVQELTLPWRRNHFSHWLALLRASSRAAPMGFFCFLAKSFGFGS